MPRPCLGLMYGIGPLARQFLIREAFASDMLHCQNKPRTIVRQLAKVVAKYLFVQIAEQVKRLNRNIRALQSALEQTPEVFQSIGVNLPVNVRFGMVDNLMLESVILESHVGHERIGVDRTACFDVSANIGLQRELLAIGDGGRANPAAALQDAHYSGLVFYSALGNHSLAPIRVHESRRATNKRLIYFDFFTLAAKLNRILFVKGKPNAVHHVPSRLLRDSQRAAYFVGTDSVLGVHDEPNANHPFIHAERRILKDGSYLDGELLLAALAEPDAARRDKRVLSGITTWTRHLAIRPAQLYGIVERLLWIAEERYGLLQGLRHFEGLSHA
jgi:hypothetical protein